MLLVGGAPKVDSMFQKLGLWILLTEDLINAMYSVMAEYKIYFEYRVLCFAFPDRKNKLQIVDGLHARLTRNS